MCDASTLYFSIRELRKGLVKFFMGSWKNRGYFCQ